MFGSTSEKAKLEKQYKQLLAEAHKLSHRDRRAGDAKMAEAYGVLAKLEKLEKAE